MGTNDAGSRFVKAGCGPAKALLLGYLIAISVAVRADPTSGVPIGSRVPPAQGQDKRDDKARPQSAGPKKKVTFKLVQIGQAIDPEDGTTATTEKLSASDGETVYRTAAGCGSVAGAKATLEKIISGRVKILERGPKIDKDGRAVGERVLLVYRDGRPLKKLLAWTDGPLLHVTFSGSLEDILALENGAKVE